jgi:hypothetical protein
MIPPISHWSREKHLASSKVTVSLLGGGMKRRANEKTTAIATGTAIRPRMLEIATV